ncbi:RNA polymerase sigma factor [Streptomyces physcomitrii]|uniref:Sigma-70 family RNA polymerase sigma factor n=1 Tax=Streptomyces physcomitrii TaxID=2724184 RepID=A0ABX1H1N9_9ACTN|nr:sigma-70 family RNA polymerase sigma factor [Streptomyces physcomitrii]NKI42260.1 sigma-70 family RNA polymerase sigma factor [Streptomyces physcomitrii]
MIEASQKQHDFTTFIREEKVEKQLRLYLVKRGVSEHEEGDISQYALMKLWEKWSDTKEPLAFAFTVAKGRWIDLLRYKQRHATAVDFLADWMTEVADPECDPAQFAMEKQLVSGLVKKLPTMQRHVFVCAMHGMPPRHIAKELHLGEATVRSHLRHSRQRLRNLLEEDPELCQQYRSRCKT